MPSGEDVDLCRPFRRSLDFLERVERDTVAVLRSVRTVNICTSCNQNELSGDKTRSPRRTNLLEALTQSKANIITHAVQRSKGNQPGVATNLMILHSEQREVRYRSSVIRRVSLYFWRAYRIVSSLCEATMIRTWPGRRLSMLDKTSSRHAWYICDVASTPGLIGSSYSCSRANRRSCSM